VWGIPGAILAVPITAVLRIMVSSSPHPYARAAAGLLEGRWSVVELDDDDDGAQLSGAGVSDAEAGASPPPRAGKPFDASAHTPRR
jgi:hypothetical protein